MRFTLVACAAALLPVANTLAATSNVGATPGSFGVQPSGAASYSIPITVPPGTAGMQPNLSLNYSSQGRSGGLYGTGVSLGGLSAIYRCPETNAQDGVYGLIGFNTDDRFCMDGQRLIVNTGDYGANNSEYRTETETFTRIRSYGSAGTGPAYFTVWTKGGEVKEYGVTTDSRIEAQGKTTVMVWALNKITDKAGNYLTVSYNEDNTVGQYWPSRIDYSGNAIAGTLPTHSVQFTNFVRPDITSAYQAGSMIKSTMLISDIKTYANGTLVKDYKLGYAQGSATLASHLANVTECAGNASPMVCLAPTILGWSNDPVKWGDKAQVLGDGSMGTPVVGDINGDGKADLIFTFWTDNPSSLHIRTKFSNGDGTWWWREQITGDGSAVGTPIVGDVNGDGKADLVFAFQVSDGLHVRTKLSNGDGTWNQKEQILGDGAPLGYCIQYVTCPAGTYPYIMPKIADVDGDGRSDLVFAFQGPNGSGLYVRTKLSNGDGTWLGREQVLGDGGGVGVPLVGDVDGDGRSDLVFSFSPGDGYLHIRTKLSYGDGTWLQREQLLADGSGVGYPYMGDVNGDGKADLIYSFYGIDGSGLHIRSKFSKGDGTWGEAEQITADGDIGKPYVGDANGDGKADLMYSYFVDGSGLHVRTKLSKGDGSWQQQEQTLADGSGVGKPLVGDANGDGRADLIYAFNTDPNVGLVVRSKFSGSTQSDLLTTITNGLGAVTRVTYRPLTDSSVYQKMSNAVYPYVDVQAPFYVVSRVTNSDGIGGDYALEYSYVGAKNYMSSRGLMGFNQVTMHDPQTAIKTTTTYRQDYPYQGAPIFVEKRTDGGVLLSRVQNTYADTLYVHAFHKSLLMRRVEDTYELNTGQLANSVQTQTTYDDFMNPTQITVDTGDGYSKTSNYTYSAPDFTKWILGRPTLVTVSSVMPGGSTLTRTMSQAYDVNGLLTQEVIEPNNSVLRLQTDYTLDNFGNRVRTTVSGAGITTRSDNTLYDANGRFPLSTTNALAQKTSTTFDVRFGTLASVIDPNLVKTSWGYDDFGRKITETRPDTTQTTMFYLACDTNCVAGEKYYVVTSATGEPTRYTYSDILNRETRSQIAGFDGRLATKATVYDSLGRVSKVSLPYFPGEAIYWASLGYDVLGRTISQTAADGGITTTSYSGLTVTVTDALNHTETRLANRQGQLIRVTDANSKSTTFTYDPFGNLLTTTDPVGNVVRMTYDLRGRKLTQTDPDLGAWRYTYDVLDELLSQTDALNKTATMTYDLLGRMTNRTEADLVSNWTYDTAQFGVGKLANTSANSGFRRSYVYDSIGRAFQEVTAFDTNYTVTATYDSAGRVSKTTFPTGFAVQNNYNGFGYLASVTRVSDGKALWTQTQADTRYVKATLGNSLINSQEFDLASRMPKLIAAGTATTSNVQYMSYSFDKVRNLKTRTDGIRNIAESYGYDALNRLTSSTVGTATTTYTYDDIGNIKTKSNTGTYTYVTPSGSAGPLPHAVKSVTGTLNASYSYDANGSLVSGAGRTVQWTTFNMPFRITQGANQVTFAYDSDHSRIQEVFSDGTKLIEFSPAVGANTRFEKEIVGTVSHYKHYLFADATPIGVYTTHSDTTPSAMQYFHVDHLGSIVAVTDDAASIVAKYQYDAYGNRSTISGNATATRRGFTGHEQLVALGLVHMNGRVFDPVLGRFMSADPYVTHPTSAQGYNRYSYVRNNPLSFTDPSGFQDEASGTNGNTNSNNGGSSYTDETGSTYYYDSRGNQTGIDVNPGITIRANSSPMPDTIPSFSSDGCVSCENGFGSANFDRPPPASIREGISTQSQGGSFNNNAVTSTIGPAPLFDPVNSVYSWWYDTSRIDKFGDALTWLPTPVGAEIAAGKFFGVVLGTIGKWTGKIGEQVAKGGMLGERGVQTASKTLWRGEGKARLDVENPNPGQRPGQLHYQDNAGNKYLYDPATNSFPNAPNSVNKLLDDARFQQAIDKGMKKYLGE